jgi:hypothetical protein
MLFFLGVVDYVLFWTLVHAFDKNMLCCVVLICKNILEERIGRQWRQSFPSINLVFQMVYPVFLWRAYIISPPICSCLSPLHRT